MPSITGLAPLIDAALDTLKKTLPAQVAAFNNGPNKVQITAPATYAFGMQDPLIGPYPVVEVAAAEVPMDIIDLALNIDAQPKLVITVWHLSDAGQLEDTYRQNLGLGKCATEVLLQRGAFGPTVGVIDSRDRGSAFGRSRVIPADISADKRTVTKWRCCYLLEIVVPQADGFA